jgi:hypothetical protein
MNPILLQARLAASFSLLMVILLCGLRAELSPQGIAGFDPIAFAQWVDGNEAPITDDPAKLGPAAVVWTKNSKPDWRGVKFGEGKAAGVRHLRIGFVQDVRVGSVLVRGGGVLSVLKLDAAYPGDLADESKWLPADRLVDGAAGRKEVDNEGYALWVLPAGTTTRALRFSHVPAAGDRESAGWLGGVWINSERFTNVAPQAVAQSTSRDDVSARLVDESNNRQWQTWENSEQGAPLPISPEHPEVVTLTWPKAVPLSGICLLWTGFSAVEVDAFNGADSENVREASNARWQRITSESDMDALYPMALGPHWLGFEKTITTRALRLRITHGAKSVTKPPP